MYIYQSTYVSINQPIYLGCYGASVARKGGRRTHHHHHQAGQQRHLLRPGRADGKKYAEKWIDR